MVTAARAAGTIEYKVLPIRRAGLKATDAGGARELSGYASRWGELDYQGDRVARGAFTETLAKRVSRPLLWNHDGGTPIGVELELVEDSAGLKGTWRLSKTTTADDVYTLLKDGVVSGLSIGFFPTKTAPSPDGSSRDILAVELLEVSVVSVPALDSARIQSVKGLPPMTIAQRMAARGLGPVPFPAPARSIAEKIATAAELKAFAAGHQSEARVDLAGVSLKTLVTSIPGPVDLRADLTEQPPAALTLVDVLDVFPTQSNRVSVPRVGTSTNAAAPVAEGALKAEGSLTFVDGTLPVQTIAWWIACTRPVLADAGEAEAIISSELLAGLKVRVEDQVINGSGVSPQLAGLLSLAGIGTVAVAGGNNLAAVLAALAQVRTASRRAPTVIVLSSTAWVSVASAAPPGLLGMSPRGLPTLLGAEVTQSDVLPVGVGLVGCAQTAPLLERQEAAVTVGEINDQMIRNSVTLLAEVRLVLTVSRQNAWCKITGLP